MGYANFRKISDISEIWATVPKEDLQELQDVFDEWDDTLDFMDNTRLALVGDPDQENWYWSKASRGCCGSKHIIVQCPSGREYFLGCNYGH